MKCYDIQIFGNSKWEITLQEFTKNTTDILRPGVEIIRNPTNRVKRCQKDLGVHCSFCLSPIKS